MMEIILQYDCSSTPVDLIFSVLGPDLGECFDFLKMYEQMIIENYFLAIHFQIYFVNKYVATVQGSSIQRFR